MTWVVASDIDGTLTGDPAALRALDQCLQPLRAARALSLFLTTGRRLDQVQAGFVDEGLPQADAIIGQVGTEIYLPPFDEARAMEAWDAHLHRRYRRDVALGFIEGIDGLRLQEEEFNTPLKLSCYLDGCADPEGAAAEVRARVAAHPGGGYQVIWSSGKDLDILPADSGKGKAVRFLVDHLGFDADRVVVAGDTGNDIAMFAEFDRGVAVANAKDELRAFVGASDKPGHILAERPYAAGVHEGLDRLGIL